VLALEDADGDSDNDSARYNSQYDDDDYSALMRVLKRFLASAKAANGIVPIGRLESQAVDVVEACVRVQIDAVFQRLRQEMIDVLTSAYDQTNRALRVSQVPVGSNSASEASECNVQPLAHQAAAKFKQTTQLVLAQMEPLVQTGAAHFAELQFLFSDVVQSQFYDVHEAQARVREPRKQHGTAVPRAHAAICALPGICVPRAGGRRDC